LVGKPEGKRPLGKPRWRLVHNIKMDFGERWWGFVDWIHWLRIRTGRELIWICWWTFRFHKMLKCVVWETESPKPACCSFPLQVCKSFGILIVFTLSSKIYYFVSLFKRIYTRKCEHITVKSQGDP
jgi:hypothetical protein